MNGVGIVLIAIEWLLFAFFLTAALLSGVTLVVAAGVLAPFATYQRVSRGGWPSWAGKLGAALAIAGAVALLVGPGIAYVVTR